MPSRSWSPRRPNQQRGSAPAGRSGPTDHECVLGEEVGLYGNVIGPEPVCVGVESFEMDVHAVLRPPQIEDSHSRIQAVNPKGTRHRKGLLGGERLSPALSAD